jgi:5-bromo-4-chloroindolyl phosphate hydrolysis protein
MSRIHELMDYYLPTAVKLVDAYREYDHVSEPGKEILEAKSDIENTLDTINSALGKLLNKLFKDSVLDVTTDAQVLKTVLTQKGLTNGLEDMKGDSNE